MLYTWNIVLSFFVILFVIWFVCRVIGWSTEWLVSKYTPVEFRIGSVGFLTVGRVQVRFKNIVLEIDKVWLSSSYLTKDIRKLVAVCAGEIRVEIVRQVETECTSAERETGSLAGSAGRLAGPAMVKKFLYYLQLLHVGVYVDSINIIILRGAQPPEGILHSTVKQISIDTFISNQSSEVSVTVDSSYTQVLRSISEIDVNEACLAIFSLAGKVSASFSPSSFDIEEVYVSVIKPQATITEGLLEKLAVWRPSSSYNSMDDANASQEPSSLTSYFKLFPKVFHTKIEEAQVVLEKLAAKRKLTVRLPVVELDLQLENVTDVDAVGEIKLFVKDISGRSAQANLLSLANLNSCFQFTKLSIDWKTDLSGCFIGYHHDEIFYWLAMLAIANTDANVPVASHGWTIRSEENDKKNNLFQNKAVSISMNINSASIAVAMATTSGIKGGLTQARLIFKKKPQALSLAVCDAKLDVEVTGMYCKLSDGSASVGDLSSHHHHWNTLYYTSIIILKTSRLSGLTTTDIMIDSIQLEMSTCAFSVISQLLSAVQRYLTWGTTTRAATKQRHSQGLVSSLSGRDIQLNVQCTNFNVFTCNDLKVCCMLRLDTGSSHLRGADWNGSLQGIKLSYLKQQAGTKSLPLVRSQDISNHVLHLQTVKLRYQMKKWVIDVQGGESVSLCYSTALHMCLHTALHDLQQLCNKFKEASSPQLNNSPTAQRETPSPESHNNAWHTDQSAPIPMPRVHKSQTQVNVNIQPKVHLHLLLSRKHSVTLSTGKVEVEYIKQKTSAKTPIITIICDQHEIFQFEDVRVHSDHHSPQLKLERELLGQLQQPTNKAWVISIDKLKFSFPPHYDFADCFEEVKNLNKFRKAVHQVKPMPFTIDSPLPPDLVIKVQSVCIQLSDDPFEVKLGDSYELLCDENEEQEKRRQAMDRRIQELRKKHGLLPVRTVDELYSTLNRKSAEVYIHRHCQLYTSSPMRTKLFTWSMIKLEIVALADISLHGKDNVVHHMRQIDSESPYPEEGLDFTILWCRMVNVSVDNWKVQLRDFPQDMLDVQELHVWGKLVGAEQVAAPRARRDCMVEVESPWSDLSVNRSMMPLKFYHDFSCDVGTWTMAYGACWEPTLAQYNISVDLVNKPSIDPSRLLPFWDKFRLLLHGRLTMSVRKMRWVYLASFNPHNTTETMDWTWSNLVLDWTNAKWVFCADLDIYVHTASKYDECRLLHLPNMRLSLRLDWLCLGDPNDHHSVTPCAPNKVPEYSMQEHDSYRAFRSKNLNASLDVETRPKEDGDKPSCQFYASTLRWMDKIAMCFGRVSRPIRRGPFYNRTKPRKPQLLRHYRNLKISFNIHQFWVQYWASFAKQHGMEMHGNGFGLDATLTQSLVSVDDGLTHRPRSSWEIKDLHSELKETTIWLCNGVFKKKAAEKKMKKNYFLSLERILYQRAREYEQGTGEPQEMEEEPSRHCVQIEGLKAAWTVENRNVAFTLYDGYGKASMLKKNLSSDALKGFKVDTTHTPQKGNRSLSANSPSLPSHSTPSPVSRIQQGMAYSMLRQLLAETRSKPVVSTDEQWSEAVDGGNGMEHQLHGISACRTDNVLHRNWHIELYNSQVMLKGCETPGYVIVSAAKTFVHSFEHRPVWQDNELRSKTTWVGTLESMQYYATVDPGREFSVDKLNWLTKDNIDDSILDAVHHSALLPGEVSPGLLETTIPEMMRSGQSVGGVVNTPLQQEQVEGQSVQLQRIISRCCCQFYYANYGEVESETPEVPLPPADVDTDMMKQEEGADCFTLVHHDLNICTNSLQYAMILDIVNNLLLYVEPRKKELTVKLQNMKFKLQLASIEDQRTPILHRQNNLREQLLRIRRLEKELHILQKEEKEDDQSYQQFAEQRATVEEELETYKEQLLAASEELAIMVSCFKEGQLLKEQRKTSHQKKEAALVRYNEVCFKQAQWRMTEADGQIGIADINLRNFLYTKVNREDDSGSHQLELGLIKVSNLLPNSLYTEVLGPHESLGQDAERQIMLRILCRFKAPVGGISVREHIEVNVIPLTIGVTHRFYDAVMAFFFPGKNVEPDDDEDDELTESSTLSRLRKKDEKKERNSLKKKFNPSNVGDIDKMKERAAKNTMFLFVKIPQVPLRFSYKGSKDKNLTDVHEFYFLLPPLEYHNQTWTWLDLLLAIKNDSKKVLISQAIKQKLHMKSRRGEDPVRPEVREDRDKARMLLGAKLLGSDKSSKKSLFGKSSKS